MSYGVDVPSDDDPYIQIADDAMHALGNGGPLSSSIVDLFPSGKLLNHLNPMPRGRGLKQASSSSIPSGLACSRLAAQVCSRLGLGDSKAARYPVCRCSGAACTSVLLLLNAGYD